MNTEEYEEHLQRAIDHFWDIRHSQSLAGKAKDTGNRSAVTGGKQLDGMIDLFSAIALDLGVKRDWIYLKSTNLPGFFRPTKNWDMLIIRQKNELIAALEFKSQVGSFGNNFNNRVEEVVGNAVDLWTAYREDSFGKHHPPWLGYAILVEEHKKSSGPVRISSSNFEVRSEFQSTSYIERYDLLCQKLMQERHYNAASLIITRPSKEYRKLTESTSIQMMIQSFIGHVIGRL